MLIIIKFRIKPILKKKNITLTQMSKDIGISRQSLSAISNNSISMVQLETLNKISEYLNVPVNQLITSDDVSAKIDLSISNDVEIVNNKFIFTAILSAFNRSTTQKIKNTINIIWTPIDTNSSKITFSCNDHELFDISVCLAGVPYETPYSNYIFVQDIMYRCLSIIMKKKYKNTELGKNIAKCDLAEEIHAVLIYDDALDYLTFINNIEFGDLDVTKDFHISLHNNSEKINPNDDKLQVEYNVI